MWLAIDVTLTVDRHVSSLSNPKGGKRSPIIENDTHDVPILQMLKIRQQIGNEHRCVTFRPTQKLRLAQNIKKSAQSDKGFNPKHLAHEAHKLPRRFRE